MKKIILISLILVSGVVSAMSLKQKQQNLCVANCRFTFVSDSLKIKKAIPSYDTCLYSDDFICYMVVATSILNGKCVRYCKKELKGVK